jgi:RNA recognition motif-containing protein
VVAPTLHARASACQRCKKEIAISAKVFVGNLSYSTTAEELTQVLSEAGQVVDVYIPTDRATGRPRGFAFATFSSETEAAKAIELFNQREVGGRRLNVNPAEERPRRPPGGGGYAGGGGGGGGGRRYGGGGSGSYAGSGRGGAAGGGYGSAFGATPPEEAGAFGFEGGRYSREDDAPPAAAGAGEPPRKYKSKGSRRGLRARKRSL